MELMNHVRGFHFLSSVLANQQTDLFCSKCSAWNNTLNKTREAFRQFEQDNAAELRSLAPASQELLTKSRSSLDSLTNAADPEGQKKAGNCKLPEGVCFVKASRALLEKI